MKRICLILTALTLLLTGCAPRSDAEKDSYIVIHSLESGSDTKVTPEDEDYSAFLDGLFAAAGEAVGGEEARSQNAVQTRSLTYYQAPTRTVLGGSAAYIPILGVDFYDDGGEEYAEGYFCADETQALKFCFPVPAELSQLVSGWAADTEEEPAPLSASAQDGPQKIHADLPAEEFQYVSISGSARSIVIRRSESENFEFYNGDLNPAHIYTVDCGKRGTVLDIEVTMEDLGKDNNVLGSLLIDIPEKVFDKVEIAGDFTQISLDTLRADVLIHANASCVYLDLEADRLEHNITLDASGGDGCSSVSVYFDKFPENIAMELHLMPDGVINDPQSVLAANGLSAGTGKPVISINQAKEVSIYSSSE